MKIRLREMRTARNLRTGERVEEELSNCLSILFAIYIFPPLYEPAHVHVASYSMEIAFVERTRRKILLGQRVYLVLIKIAFQYV